MNTSVCLLLAEVDIGKLRLQEADVDLVVFQGAKHLLCQLQNRVNWLGGSGGIIGLSQLVLELDDFGMPHSEDGV